MTEILKTGTTTLGIVCKDCIILAADKRATAGNMIVQKDVTKVIPIHKNMALTTAGTVSDIQLLVKIVKAQIALEELRIKKIPKAKAVANLLASMVFNNIRKMSMIPGISHFLFAGTDSSGNHLFDIYPDGSISNIKNFVSSGSGSVFAYGVLESLYKENMSCEEGIDLALKAVNAALQRDSASGNGIDIIKITKDGVKSVMTKQLETKLTI